MKRTKYKMAAAAAGMLFLALAGCGGETGKAPQEVETKAPVTTLGAAEEVTTEQTAAESLEAAAETEETTAETP